MKSECDRKRAPEIKRIPLEVSGRPDGVEATVDCVVNEFELNTNGEPVGYCAFPTLRECELIASRSGGTVSLSVRGTGTMISIRLEDLANLLKAVDDASEE